MSKNKNRSPGLARFASIAATPILLLSAGVAVNAQGLLLAQTPETAPAFQLPSSLPSETGVKVDGSSSMIATNESLKQRFESKYPDTKVDLTAGGTDAALKALNDGTIDIAAIGRLLTDAEKAQGLKQVPLSREKIAIVVGDQNPFKGSLTAEQFAKMFRGEITNWSQVGGPNVPIRFIDRPASSDTRQALSQYPVFESAPFQTGSTATQLAADDTAAIVKELGTDGISYAPVSQVTNQSGVQILPMHDTLPTDPRYPYSQPRTYVYKGSANPGVIAFLGFATSTPGQEPIAAAIASPAASPTGIAPAEQPATDSTAAGTAPSPAPSPVEQPAPARKTSSSGLWWLLLPLIGLPLLLWLFKGRGAAVPPVAAAVERRGRMVLTPRDCRNAYAYWEIPNEEFSEARRQGGRDLKLRLYDVTDAPDSDLQSTRSMKEFDCAESAQDLHVPIAIDDRDYRAELGYVTADDQWLPLAQSSAVRVPACVPAPIAPEREPLRIATGTEDRVTRPVGNGLATTAAVGAAAAAAGAFAAQSLSTDRPVQPSRLILVPRTPEDTYAYWEVPEARKAELKQQGGQRLVMRLQDVTDRPTAAPDSRTVRYFECDERSNDLHIPTVPGREYVGQLGYVTQDNRWLSLAQSASVRVPIAAESSVESVTMLPIADETAEPAAQSRDLTAIQPDTVKTLEVKPSVTGRLSNLTAERTNLAGDARSGGANLLEKAVQTASNVASNTSSAVGAAIVGGTAAVAGAAVGAKSLLDRPSSGETAGKFEQPQDCRIILVARNAKDAYAYWEVSESYKQALREQGGRRLMLRVHDATNIDIDYQTPHSTQTYPCRETEQDKHVAIPASDRDYIAEVGYFTEDNRWLRLIRSFHVHVPADR